MVEADTKFGMASLKQRLSGASGSLNAVSFTKKLVVAAVIVVSLLALVIGLSVGLTRKVSSRRKEENGRFDHNYAITWAPDHVKLLDDGHVVQLALDQTSGSGFGSKNKYLYGNLGMQLKLVSNNSAGTVTAFYMSSLTDDRSEFDYEFLGNVSGQPYILQTNIYVNGVGNREERIFLWFDPTADFHTYTVRWNEHQLTFLVDDIPIRVYRNNSGLGIPYPYEQPVGIYSSIWNGDQWATRGGLDKVNWTYAPFIASYRNFEISGCQWTGFLENCLSHKGWWNDGKYHYLDQQQMEKLNWVKQNYMIYNYCTDTKRFSPLPSECGANP